jgi:3-dehydroquinate synthase
MVTGSWQDDRLLLSSNPAEPIRVPVSVQRTDTYDILIDPGCLRDWVRYADVGADTRVWVITDEVVWSLHGPALMNAPEAHRLVAGVFVVPAAEASKSLETWQSVQAWLSERGAARRDLLVAFGGAVVSDLTGFVAATYMRGIRYGNVPTSLLAQVDGAMGGKVAVNSPEAKNLIGAFHHPSFVLSDPNLLRTLDRAELANGVAEVIKTVVIESSAAFDYVASSLDALLRGEAETLFRTVSLCASIKMHVLAPDPYEDDLRRSLNFGHTIGHAIETSQGYAGIRHGEAIAIGMATAARLGVRRGLTAPSFAQRLVALIEHAGLPVVVNDGEESRVVQGLDAIRAIRGRALRFVVPITPGQIAILDDVTAAELAAALIDGPWC